MIAKDEVDNKERLVEMCARIFRHGCRDERVLRFLGKYYETGSNELYQVFQAIKGKQIDDNTAAERLLVQYEKS